MCSLQYAQDSILQLLDQKRSTVLAPISRCQTRGQIATRGQKEILKKKYFQDISLYFSKRQGKGMEEGQNLFCTE